MANILSLSLSLSLFLIFVPNNSLKCEILGGDVSKSVSLFVVT